MIDMSFVPIFDIVLSCSIYWRKYKIYICKGLLRVKFWRVFVLLR